jgi:hypothetical protein
MLSFSSDLVTNKILDPKGDVTSGNLADVANGFQTRQPVSAI